MRYLLIPGFLATSLFAVQINTNISSSGTACTNPVSTLSCADYTVEGNQPNAYLPAANLAFVAEGRWGNNRRNGSEYEFDLQAFNQTMVTGQYFWDNNTLPLGTGNLGLATQFTLTFNRSTNLATFVLGDPATSTDVLTITVTRNVTDLFIRTRGTSTAGGTQIFGLTYTPLSGPGANTPQSLGNATSLAMESTANRQIDYLWISGLGNESFRLTGYAAFQYPSNANNLRSNLAFQIKAGVGVDPTPVPEPAPLLLIGAALAGLGFWRRRQRARP